MITDNVMKKIHYIPLFFIAFAILVPTTSIASPRCPTTINEQVYSSLGSGGAFSNLSRASSSVKLESKVTVEAAIKKLDDTSELKKQCPAECTQILKREVTFRSVPNKTLSEYTHKATCSELYAKTRKNPLLFSPKSFLNVDDIIGWFIEFTQGKGDEGHALYEQCPGSCAPQYSITISKTNDGLSIKPTAVCGAARDKDDDKYKLSSYIKFVCG